MKDKDPSHASSKKSRKKWKWLVIPVLVVLVGLVLYRGWGFTQKRSGTQRAARTEVPVQVVSTAFRPLTYSMRVTGDIMPLMQVDLFPKVSGYLERIDVHIGDVVKQGQVIAQIDRRDYLHKVREIEAKVAQAKAQLMELETGTRTEDLRQAEEAVRQAQSRFENAKLQRERIEALYKREVISKKERDVTDMEYTVAEAQLASSQQQLKLLQFGARQEVKDASRAKLKEMEAILEQERNHLKDTQIVAPFRGEISRKYVDAGAFVSPSSPSTPLVSLVHTETLKIVANVLEKDIPLLKPGMKAKIRVESYPEKVFEGSVEKINSALELSTRTLQAEIYVLNTNRFLKPGMFANVEVVLLEKPQAVVIPREAVIEAGKEMSVFVIEGKRAVRRPITIGYEQDRMVEVLKGLSVGDQIVIKGQQLIKDGSAIRVVEGS
ncbi:MAG TPA: efflux RND transporter periplasmic adaptor subunit [Thermodesulfobacteriota bacterium]|nr:efflux RND transporter periplasmic adaptor subunit [Thermodesulfobacteriota bacterium]